MTGTHTAVASTAKGIMSTIQVPTPIPGPLDVLVKVAYSAIISMDKNIVDHGFLAEPYPAVLGFNAAGTVVQVGEDVESLAIGDRITGFGVGHVEGKGLQQFAVFPANCCAKVPASLELTEAVTIPDNFVTAYYTLFDQLSLPLPTSLPATTPPVAANKPILVYGSGSTVGMYTIQLLKLAGYTKILTTASKQHHEYLHGLGASDTFDYASPTLVEDILRASGGTVPLAVSCISSFTTLAAISKVISGDGKLAIVLPITDSDSLVGNQVYFELPADRSPFKPRVELIYIATFNYMMSNYKSMNIMSSVLTSILESSSLQPNRVRLLDEKDGSIEERVRKGLDMFRRGEVRGEKIVVKID